MKGGHAVVLKEQRPVPMRAVSPIVKAYLLFGDVFSAVVTN
jgi:hypothetical protein